jgi:hypothetical protein
MNRFSTQEIAKKALTTYRGEHYEEHLRKAETTGRIQGFLLGVSVFPVLIVLALVFLGLTR